VSRPAVSEREYGGFVPNVLFMETPASGSRRKAPTLTRKLKKEGFYAKPSHSIYLQRIRGWPPESQLPDLEIPVVPPVTYKPYRFIDHLVKLRLKKIA
jgi:hypothetical protein